MLQHIQRNNHKLEVANKELTDIGDINGRPETFYETIKEVYDPNKM